MAASPLLSALSAALKRKPIFLNGLPAGDAATWEEVAEIVSAVLGRRVSVHEVQRRGSEGPESFLVNLPY